LKNVLGSWKNLDFPRFQAVLSMNAEIDFGNMQPGDSISVWVKGGTCCYGHHSTMDGFYNYCIYCWSLKRNVIGCNKVLWCPYVGYPAFNVWDILLWAFTNNQCGLIIRHVMSKILFNFPNAPTYIQSKHPIWVNPKQTI